MPNRTLVQRGGPVARTAISRTQIARTALPALSLTGAVQVVVDRTTIAKTSKFSPGFNITQRGLGKSVGSNTYGSNMTVDGDTASVAQAIGYLSAFRLGNLHIGGQFGTGNVWPDPTVALDYTQPFLNSGNQWYSADYIIDKYRKTGAAYCITLFKTPEWMGVNAPSGTPGTPSSWVNSTLNPPYVGDYPGPYTGVVNLAAYSSHIPSGKPPGYTGAMDGNSLFAYYAQQIALRYSDAAYICVYNECMNKVKGYQKYATTPSAPTFSDITTLMMPRYMDTYNAVYSAIKAVNPNIKVIGPYYSMGNLGSGNVMNNTDTAVLNYFMTHATGCDALGIDGTSAFSTSSSTRPPDIFTQMDQSIYHLYQTNNLISLMASNGWSNVPLLWMETYGDTNNTHANYATDPFFTGSPPASYVGFNFADHDYWNALLTSMMCFEMWGGAAGSFRWETETSQELGYQDARYNRHGNVQSWLTQCSPTNGNPAPVGAQGGLPWSTWGGQPQPAYWGAWMVSTYCKPGTPLYSVTVTDPAAPTVPRVEAYGTPTGTILINKWNTPQTITVSYDGGATSVAYRLARYGVALVP